MNNEIITALELLKSLSLDEVIQVRKNLEELKAEEMKHLEPIQRVNERDYNACLNLVKHTYFDSCMICALVEREKLDNLD